MSKRIIQDLHAGISRRDWSSVEAAANRLRDDVEKTVATLAGAGIGSLPNDYPLSKLAKDAINRPFGSPVESDTRLQAAAREAGWALSTLVDSIAWDKRQRVAAIIGELSLALHNPSPESLPVGIWLPIAQADRTINHVTEFTQIGLTLKNSDTFWVRDEDGRVYRAAWSEGNKGRDYWWDWEGESPVDPVEFMPHPLDLRFHPDAKLEDQP
jgi:hypothetical protein